VVKTPHFILVGNGPYSNRGCEAIVRGTLAILRREFGDRVRVTVVSMAPKDVVDRQAAVESDSAIAHIAHDRGRGRWSADWAHLQILKCLHPFSDVYYRPRDLPKLLTSRRYGVLDAHLKSADAVLQIGGDNYSLDYGWPEAFLAVDRYVQRHGVPVVLWGASVGPFDAAPRHAQEAMIRHLASMRAILVRESASHALLMTQRLANVFTMTDPAFVMQAQEPDVSRLGFALPSEFIGMNFSSLMAQYVTGGDMPQWVALCREMISRTLQTVHCPVVLIPHVTHSGDRPDDVSLMRAILQGCDTMRGRVMGLPGTLTSAQTKWVIARSAAFVGARTHATIAAMSSGVPTLSLAYSRKAVGLNQDVFGSQEFCIMPKDMASPGAVVARLERMIADADPIRRRLNEIMPVFASRAFAAGPLLRRVLAGDTPPRQETAR
jgi:colanic acid/amylovoran biosynthesis protein